MATVDLGKLAFVDKGTWSNATTYAIRDVVQHTDQNEVTSYLAVAASSNQAPSTNGTVNTSYWRVMAKGATIASNNEGTYAAGTTYEKGDIVQYTDSGVLSTYLYINASPASGQTPSTGGTVNGSHWQFIAKGTASVSIAYQSTAKTANFTAAAAEGYFVDTTGGAITVTTPASPSVGDEFILIDLRDTFGTNNVTLDGNGSDKIKGTTDNYILSEGSLRIVYSGATYGWLPVSSSAVVSAPLQLPYDVEYLVVGAGAGGGGDNGGGGGAGGFRFNGSKNFSVVGGVSYTITVGTGGVGGTNDPSTSPSPNSGAAHGASGGESTFSTITSAGGGGGGSSGSNGVNGGSGGGGGQAATGGSGNTPSVSPSQGNNGGNSTSGTGGDAGGGGAGAVGGSGSGGSNGGAGSANSITGSSVTYAGGGGGGEDQGTSSNAGSGGSGGGGAGGNGGANTGSAGTNGLGGGGGGGGQNGSATGGRGGSGIVIIRRATSASTSASGSVTTSGTDTIHTFTSSGTFTA